MIGNEGWDPGVSESKTGMGHMMARGGHPTSRQDGKGCSGVCGRRGGLELERRSHERNPRGGQGGEHWHLG